MWREVLYKKHSDRSMYDGLEVVKLVMSTGSYTIQRKRSQRFLNLRLNDWVAGGTIF